MDFDQICVGMMHGVVLKLNKNKHVKFASISKNSRV